MSDKTTFILLYDEFINLNFTLKLSYSVIKFHLKMFALEKIQ